MAPLITLLTVLTSAACSRQADVAAAPQATTATVTRTLETTIPTTIPTAVSVEAPASPSEASTTASTPNTGAPSSDVLQAVKEKNLGNLSRYCTWFASGAVSTLATSPRMGVVYTTPEGYAIFSNTPSNGAPKVPRGVPALTVTMGAVGQAQVEVRSWYEQDEYNQVGPQPAEYFTAVLSSNGGSAVNNLWGQIQSGQQPDLGAISAFVNASSTQCSGYVMDPQYNVKMSPKDVENATTPQAAEEAAGFWVTAAGDVYSDLVEVNRFKFSTSGTGS